MPQDIYFNDGAGNIRKVPANKVDTFKKYFPKATQADENQLSEIESKRAAQSEKAGKTKIVAPEIKPVNTRIVGGGVSFDEGKTLAETATDVYNIHKTDPEISFRAKYGAYKQDPALFRDKENDATQTPLPSIADEFYKKNKKSGEMESLQDFLANTQQGRGFVDYDKARQKYFEDLDVQLTQEITNLERKIKEKGTARQQLIDRPVPGTRYGVNPQWLSAEERARIEAEKSKDVEEANKIATQDDLNLAAKNLQELKMLQAAVNDRNTNAVAQFFNEAGRRLPKSLYNIGTMGFGEVIEGLDPRKGGELSNRSEGLLSQYASLHQQDRTMAQDIAQGAVGSLEFMAQFAGAGGVVSGLTKNIGKSILTAGAKKAATKGAGKVLKIAGREVSESLLQTAIMPSTIAMAIENNAQNPGSFLDSFANAYLSNLVEVGSERMGQFIPGPKFKLPGSVQKLQKATGIDGMVGEFLEEQIATIGHSAIGDGQAEWSDLIDPRQQLITAGVVGIIQLPYASINAGGYAAGKFRNVNQKRSINKAFTQNMEAMNAFFGTDTKPTIMWLNNAIDKAQQSGEGISSIMTSIVNQGDFTEEQTNAILNYGLSYLAKKGLETAKEEQIQNAQAEARQLAEQAVNLETNSIILATVPGMEEPTRIQGNVILREDGSIDAAKSGEIYYTDAEGKRKVIDPKFIEIVENVPAEQAIEELSTMKAAEVVNQQANDEVRPYEPGEVVRFTSDGNVSLLGQIQGADESGNYQVIVDGVPAPVIVEPRMIINEDNLQGVDNGILVDYRDDAGNVFTGTVDDMSIRGHGVIVIDGNEIRSENVIGVHQERENEAPSTIKTSEETPRNEGATIGQTPQNVTETAETETESQITAEQQQAEQAEAEKQTFMQSLPVVESGKNKGQIDQSQMTPEQNIRYFEYQYGQEKAVQAAMKMSENLTKRIKKEQEKLENDPFNIAQNELVDQLQAQMEAYKNYAFARMQEQTERNIAVQSGPSVTQSKQQRSAGIQQEEAGRTGTAEPTIKEKWDAADKIEGIEDVITLASGEKIPGRYILTTADAPSPSHDIERNFAKTKGFPTNEQGNTVNDRDYESDKTAQILVQQRANKYDEQAVQNPVVVSRDGIVISGNDRTMAGKIAARNGTDKAYVDYITKYADRWGFTPEMVTSMQAPRIVFVPDVELPYNTATFAKFNAEDKKTQSTLDRAIKSSKSVSREIIIPISEVVDGFNSLAEFYADSNATQKVLQVLTRNSIVQPNEIPRLMDGDVFSAEGRSFLETLLLGAVLQEQALREVDAMRSVRQSLMRIMPQLARNAALSDYTLIPELNNAIHLLYESKRSGSKVKLHLMQTNVFEASPADVYAEIEKLIAIMLENARDTEIRAIFESYNKEAAAIESGQTNMFDGVLSKPSLLTLILNKYGQQAEINQQDGSPSQGDGQGDGNRSGHPTGSGSGSGQQQPKGQQPGSIEAEAAKVDTNPSEAQKEAGNYKKGHVNVQGFDITIENPKGSVRSGIDASGKQWSVEMKNHYGYFKRTEGYDGDQIDTFIGENLESGAIFVVDQVNNDKTFDESKVMLGFNSIDEAREAYLSNYEAGWQGLGAIIETTVDDFKKWLYDGAKQRKAFSEYKENKPEYGANNKIITTDRYNELREQMRKKLNNLNVGFDPEVFSIGAQMAMYHIESGAHKFADFAKRMVDDLGDAIRPYLKASYEGARAMPGMEELSKTMDPYNDVVAFNVNKDFNEDIQPIKNIKENEQRERVAEVIEAEAEAIEAASGTIRSESENVGSNQQRAGQVKEKADEQVDKVERLLKEVDQKLSNLRLSDKNYSTDGIIADYPISVLAKGPIKKDATAYVKAVAAMTGLEHDTDRKGKTEIVNVNIAPAGGDVTFVLWSKTNPDYGVYVSIPYDSDYTNNGYDNYKVRDNNILWRITTKQNKWRGLSNQYINSDATAQEMTETLLKGLNSHFRSIGLAEEAKPETKDIPEIVKTKKINKKTSAKVAKNQTNMLTLFGEDDVSPIKNDQDDKPGRRNEEANSSLGERERKETGRTEQGGLDRGDVAHNGVDREGSRRISGLPDNAEELHVKNTNNNRNERGVDYSPKSPKARFNANIDAINLMRKLNDSGITVPTREQMDVLRKYSGWGGLGTYFNNDSNENRTLRALLSAEEYQDASDSVRSAYYTPADVIDSLWDIAKRLGFRGGNILESSAGIGSILGYMPKSISDRSNIEGVEIDAVSGEILKLLYPDAKIHVQGFEDTSIQNGSVDLAITNVPFVTGLNVHDPIDKDLSRKFKNIHDFVIAKNIRKIKEGGIGIFITTKGTMDSSKKLREWIGTDGSSDVIGAFRLNNETFEGTGVTSDIIVVRKRVAGKIYDGAIDIINTTIVRSEEYETEAGEWVRGKGYVKEVKQVDLIYNKYFADNPQFMGGEMAFGFEHGDTYRPESISLFPKNGVNQKERLSQWVDQFDEIKGIARINETAKEREVEATTIKEGQLFIDSKGNIAISSRGLAEDPEINNNKVKGRTKKEVLNDYNAIKESVDALLKYQVDNQNDSGLKPLLNKLNKSYDSFVSKYGQLNNNVSLTWLRKDVDFPAIAALEKYSEKKTIDGKKIIKVNKTLVFTKRVIGYKSKPEPKNIKDAVIASVYEYNDINIPYISEALSIDEDSAREKILNEELGFSNPQTGAIEIRHRYLSGNVREKLKVAKDSNVNGEYDANIRELEKVIPMDIPTHLIDITIGSTWVPPSVFERYFMDRYGVRLKLQQTEGSWVIQPASKSGQYTDKNRQLGVYSKMFQETIMGDELAYAAMNNRNVVFKKIRKNSDGSQETITDKEATAEATRRISEIKGDFVDWVKDYLKTNEELSDNIMNMYNDKFNAIVPISIDEKFIPERFDGAATFINLYTHQKKAAIRATMQPIMLAHEVGTGKTFTLITAAMEMRRVGTAKKPMIVVQNATIGQFVTEAKTLYPNAKILALSDSDRDKKGRLAFYANIKYNDWDMVVIPQSTFDMIPDSPERQNAFIQEKIDEKIRVIEAMKDTDADSRMVKQMENQLDDLYAELAGRGKKKNKKSKDKSKGIAVDNAATRAKAQLDRRTDDVQYFDDLGVDALLIDEAHAYKKLGYETTMARGVKGIDTSRSKRAAGLYIKSRAILEKSGWKNFVLATGTPITNTAAELWTFMRFLLKKETLIENDMYYFDDFAKNFGSIDQMLEFATSGKYKENTRFAKYINLAELVRIWASVSDTVLTKDASYVNDKVPDMETGEAQDVYLEQSDTLVDIMRAVRKRLDEFDKMTGKEKKENSYIPIVMYGIAKRAAIDTRLIDKNSPDEPLSKTNRTVDEVLRSLEDTKAYNGTVAVFCDSQNRKDDGVITFNIFEDIKQKLINKGVPENQIVIMKSGMNIKQKQKIFADVNEGTSRVIMGSTETLGTGVNIQERLHTLIHMDAPDLPMQYTQRMGRILRQGNLHKEWNKPVRVLRFGVVDSLDVTAYQRLQTKSNIINSVMDGKTVMANAMENRSIEEASDTGFGNTVAQLSGSQYALLKDHAEKELQKLLGKRKQHEYDQIYIANQTRRNSGIIRANESIIKDSKDRLNKIRSFFPEGKAKSLSIAGKKIEGNISIEEALREYVNKPVNEFVENSRKNTSFKSSILPFEVKADNVTFIINVKITRDSAYDERAKGLRISMRRNISYASEQLNMDDVPVSGAYAREAINDIIENVIPGKDDSDRIEHVERAINRLNDENESMNARKGKEFDLNDELEEAEKKVEEYTVLMQKELEEKEKKYQERGSGKNVDVETIELEDEDQADDEDILYRSVDESGFYSTVEDALEQIKQEKGTPDQFKAMLLKNGAKQAELDWMGWDERFGTDHIDPKMTVGGQGVKLIITKSEIQDWINQNRIEVQEVEKGNRIKEINEKFEKKKDDWVHNVAYDAYKNGADRNKSLFHAENIRNAVSSRDEDQLNETTEDWEYLNKYNNPDEIDLNEIHDIEEDQKHQQYAFAEDTKFSKYTLPGGENYKELLLTMPVRINPIIKITELPSDYEFIKDGDKWGVIPVDQVSARPFSGMHETQEAARRSAIDKLNRLSQQDTEEKADNNQFKSSHFEERNILAHIRFNERTVNGERVLFIEEIQSDWAQKGKKEGFKSDNRKAITESLRKEKDNFYTKLNESEDKQVEYGLSQFESGKINREQLDKILLANGYSEYDLKSAVEKNSVPDMPFKKTGQWVNLALRRMMMYAAENDYDRIAWTTGEQQADRYDLSKQISELEIRTDEEDSNRVAVWVNNDLFKYANKEELPDIIGKEMAKKAISDLETRKNVYYSGLDLKVGGEGMIAFYDQIVPKAAKKLGKPFGADVETINLPISNEEITQNNADDEVEELTYKYESGELELDEFISEMNKIGYNVEVGMDGEVESANRKGAVYKSVQSIPVTDALREIAPNGMPLFRKRDTEAREAYAMREWNRAKRAIDDLAAKMGVSVEIIETTDGLPKAKAEAKGWYDTKSKKIAIVMPNHSNSWDAQATFLHEAVGHHGLRELFGEHFDTFLDNVYNNAEEEIKAQIDKKAQDKGWAVRKATEEYLSKLAEDQEILQSDRLSGFFNSVKKFFFDMLAKIGFNPGFKLSNNELKYILWRSYQNLAEPGRYRSVVDQAKDVAMQYGLKVGNYEEKTSLANVAEEPGSGLPTAITVDGVERSTTNSNGRPIASSKEGIRNFWRWFGDSKVVDAEGRPIVVYHATQSDFNEFKTQKIGTSVDFGTLGSGFYFTTSAENANNYASNLNTNTGKQSGESIMPVYLKINNPYDAQQLREVSGDSKKESENFTNKNKKKGHDGAKFEWRSDFVWYVAFNPNQIKSAIGNTGTFDPGNDDIRYRSVSDAADEIGSKMPEDLRNEYDVKYNQFFTRFREAWEDTYLPVKNFLDLLRNNNVEISDYNDFYKQATHLQGKNDAQLKIFKDSFQHKITLAVNKLEKAGFKYRDIENYVFAKHGLERNEYMRNAAIQEWDNNHPDATDDQRAAFIDSLPSDYAGITALEEEFGVTAQEYIDGFEETADAGDVRDLWTAINDATMWTLTKQYKTGMMSKDTYDELTGRYQYYVPLRGHDKETAEDRWDYTPDMGTYFTAPLLKAEGRRSRAESPFAYVAQMAHSAIAQGNKNTLKQSILRLAQKDNGGLMSATKTWKVNIGTADNPIWEQQSAPYSEDVDTYLNNQRIFEERMQELKNDGMAYQGRTRLNIGDLFIKQRQAEQHEIQVYQNGISHTVYINANPAIARAINGANRKDVSQNLGFIANVTRSMAANFTTRNPLFIMTNFSRDYIFSSTMLLAKETPKFAGQFQMNIPKALGALQRYERGKVNLNNKSDRYLYEYLINGGKTGFSHIFELDRVAKSLEREAKKGGSKNLKDHGIAVLNVIDTFNEIAENTTRLSAYITSRENGRNITDSVSDAKNITVNFNQKGAGSSVGKNSFEQFIFSASGWVRPLYLFTNAAVQALSNVLKVTAKHPIKMASIIASYSLLGFISPLLAQLFGGDDGEEAYLKLTDWERQNNWCILLPNGSFLKIPLPHELRVFHRLGDNIYQSISGKQDVFQTLLDTMFSIADLLPMNPMGAAKTSWAELVPDAIRPFAQLITNTNFMGSKVYNEWANKNMPGYLKARTNKKGEYYAPNFMVDWFMYIDHITGGDSVKKGVISLNPDIANHLLRGYFGGLYTLAEQGVGIASETYNLTQTGEFNIKIRETPLKTFYADKNDLRIESSGLSSKYYEVSDKVSEARRRDKGYFEKVKSGEMAVDEYARRTQELNMENVNNLYDRIREIRKIEQGLKEMDPDQQKEAERMIFNLKKEVVDMNNLH